MSGNLIRDLGFVWLASSKESRSVKVAATILAVLIPQLAVAQPEQLPGRATVLATNMLIGGLTAGLSRAFAKKPFIVPIIRGSLGGGVVFAGKSVVGQNNDLTALIGRGVGAVGASEVRSAAVGKPVLHEIILPVGPVHVYVDRKTLAPRVKLDLSTALASGYLALRPGATFQPKRSMVRGVMVFENPDGSTHFQSAGAVSIRDFNSPNWERETSRVMGHELVHVIQSDFLAIAFSQPFEAWLLAHVRGGRTLHKYVDIGIMNPVWAVANGELDIWDRPWEKESRRLSR